VSGFWALLGQFAGLRAEMRFSNALLTESVSSLDVLLLELETARAIRCADRPGRLLPDGPGVGIAADLELRAWDGFPRRIISSGRASPVGDIPWCQNGIRVQPSCRPCGATCPGVRRRLT
jgi:hypothetical protein